MQQQQALYLVSVRLKFWYFIQISKTEVPTGQKLKKKLKICFSQIQAKTIPLLLIPKRIVCVVIITVLLTVKWISPVLFMNIRHKNLLLIMIAYITSSTKSSRIIEILLIGMTTIETMTVTSMAFM